MEFRKLGRTNLAVSVISLGTEYLNEQPRETVVATVRAAMERGVNYLDLLFAFPEYRDNLAAALQGHRDRMIYAGHLGSVEKDGQYQKTRSVKKSEQYFHDLLARMGTDYVDVLFLHNFDSVKDWDKVTKPRGLLDMARRFRQEGKARFLAISGHNAEVMTLAIETGEIDVLMFPINIAANALPGRKELLNLCVQQDIGIVAMKPFAGGKLLQQKRTIRLAKYQTGGESYKQKVTASITPTQCISYVLAQVGISAALPGVKNTAELAESLHYLEATAKERDFSAIIADFDKYAEGECVYCNHCLPCPAMIDIGQVNRLVDMAPGVATNELRAAYSALAVAASACTECGSCVERCPFGVDVIARMCRAVELFEQV